MIYVFDRDRKLLHGMRMSFGNNNNFESWLHDSSSKQLLRGFRVSFVARLLIATWRSLHLWDIGKTREGLGHDYGIADAMTNRACTALEFLYGMWCQMFLGLAFGRLPLWGVVSCASGVGGVPGGVHGGP